MDDPLCAGAQGAVGAVTYDGSEWGDDSSGSGCGHFLGAEESVEDGDYGGVRVRWRRGGRRVRALIGYK